MTESTTTAPIDANTGAGLIEFLDAAIDKGWFNVGSAKALKIATKKIFEVESGWESMDLRSLDADSLYARFCNLKRNAYSDDSMRIYRTRFQQALKMHLARLDGDSNWRSYGPAARPSKPGNGTKPSSNGSKAPKPSTSSPSVPSSPVSTLTGEDDMEDQAPSSSATPLMRFPFPLRDTVDVWLSLPRDLTKAEAERLCVFIGSLARDDVGAPASGEASI
jgi:hypothetical protein